MKTYISGQITGLDLSYATERFEQGEIEVKQLDWHPVNPMVKVPYNKEWTWEQYMLADIKLIFDCKAMYMLSNWKASKGARIEHALAVELGLQIFYQPS